MLKIIIGVGLCLSIGYEVYLLIRSFFNLRLLMLQHKKNDVEMLQHRITLLLPCYKEYNIIDETVDYFDSICKKYNNVDVFLIVGNEYENDEIVQNDSYKRISSLLAKLEVCENIKLIYDSTEFSTKSTKINSAIDYIQKNCLKTLYIGVFDFDSRPDSNMINYINSDIQKKIEKGNEFPCVYQPISCICNILNPKSIFVKIYSILHYKRSLAIEGRLLFSQSKKVRYCTGACVFFNINDVIGADRFEIENDDIVMGYKLQLLEKRIVIIPYLNKVDSVETFIRGKKQLLRIYDGLFKYKKVLCEYGKKARLISKIDYLFNTLFDIYYESIQLIFCLMSVLINPILLLVIYSFYYVLFVMYYIQFLMVTKEKIQLRILINGIWFCMLNHIIRVYAIIHTKLKKIDSGVYFE